MNAVSLQTLTRPRATAIFMLHIRHKTALQKCRVCVQQKLEGPI